MLAIECPSLRLQQFKRQTRAAACSYMVIITLGMGCVDERTVHQDEKQMLLDDRPVDANAPSEPGLPAPQGSIEVLSVRIAPWTNPSGALFKEVLVDWRNTGETPVRAVTANILGYDSRGKYAFGVADYTIYTVLDDLEPGIPPGAVYKEPKGEGHKLPAEVERADVHIRGVFELSGMGDLTEEEYRDRANQEAQMASAIEAAKWRIWTTADGRHTVDARFVKAASGKLTLEKRDGSTVVVEMAILCHEDQDFVLKRKWLDVADDVVKQSGADSP